MPRSSFREVASPVLQACSLKSLNVPTVTANESVHRRSGHRRGVAGSEGCRAHGPRRTSARRATAGSRHCRDGGARRRPRSPSGSSRLSQLRQQAVHQRQLRRHIGRPLGAPVAQWRLRDHRRARIWRHGRTGVGGRRPQREDRRVVGRCRAQACRRTRAALPARLRRRIYASVRALPVADRRGRRRRRGHPGWQASRNDGDVRHSGAGNRTAQSSLQRVRNVGSADVSRLPGAQRRASARDLLLRGQSAEHQPRCARLAGVDRQIRRQRHPGAVRR